MVAWWPGSTAATSDYCDQCDASTSGTGELYECNGSCYEYTTIRIRNDREPITKKVKHLVPVDNEYCLAPIEYKYIETIYHVELFKTYRPRAPPLLQINALKKGDGYGTK